KPLAARASAGKPDADGVLRVGEQADGERDAGDDEQWLDEAGAFLHGEVRAEAGTRELRRTHHQPGLPDDRADEGESNEAANVRRKVQQLGVRGGLEHAVSAERDEGEHEEGTGTWPEQAVVKADH